MQELTQQEIDALMRGMGAEEPDAPEPEPDPGGVRRYDLSSQERIVRGRMPTLDIVMERFARNLRAGVFSLIRRNAEVSVNAPALKKFSAFLREIVVPTNFNIVSVRPLRGSALVVCEPTLIFAVVDAMFGGSGKWRTRIEGREFSPTEQRIIARLVQVITAEYNRAWAGIYPIELEYQRSEMQPQFANVAAPGEVVVAVTVSLEIGDGSGAVHICIPYATLEPIRDILNSSLQGDTREADTRWVELLSRQIQSVDVELVAELGHAELTVEQLIAMEPGDIVELSLGREIEAKVAGVPVFDCQYGVANGRYALKVGRTLTAASDGWLDDPRRPGSTPRKNP